MHHISKKIQRLCKNTQSRTRVDPLSLSLLLVAVFATSLFFVPKPSVSLPANEEAVYIDDNNNLIIQGNCTTDEILSCASGSSAYRVQSVHFTQSVTIETRQTGNYNSPFGQLVNIATIVSDPGVVVSFQGKDGAAPTLKYFFSGPRTAGASSLSSVDGLSAWDVSNVTDMSAMFADCRNLTSLDGLAAWDVSQVSTMEEMFCACESLTSLDGLSGWDTSALRGEECMTQMFYECNALNSLAGLASWDVSQVETFNQTFYNCDNLTNLDALSSWDVSSVKIMYRMFDSCSGLVSLDGLSEWNIASVTGPSCMSLMFSSCTSLVSLDGLAKWDVSNVEGDSCMSSMFGDCTSLVSIDGLASWNIDKALDSSKSPDGVSKMFGAAGSGSLPISSITLGAFKLSSAMNLPSATWWPVEDASAAQGIDTASLITQSQSQTPQSFRWQRCATDSQANPMKEVSSLVVEGWQDNDSSTYTGAFQQFLPQTVTAHIQSEQSPSVLEYGKDYYIVYQKPSNAESFMSVKDADTYSATLMLRGAYRASSSYPLPTQTKTIAALDLTKDIYSPTFYCLPSSFNYDGQSHLPRFVSVRLDLGQAQDGQGNPYEKYFYLVSERQNKQGYTTGDYSFEFPTQAIEKGKYSATINPITNNLAPNKAFAHFFILGDDVEVVLNANGGSFDGGTSQTKTLTLRQGQDITEAEVGTVKRTGYVLAGWKDEKGNVYSLPYNIPSNATSCRLEAVWSNPATVTIELGQGSFSDGSHTKTINTFIGASLDLTQIGEASYPGYDLVGWTDAKGVPISLPYLITSPEATLIAKWAEPAQITLLGAGGSFVGGDSEKVVEKHVADILEKEEDLEEPTRPGYTFSGWMLDGVKVEFPYTIERTQLVFSAAWEKAPEPIDTVTIIFKTDEGSWNGMTQTTLVGKLSNPIIAPVYPDVDATRTCIGWFDEAGKEIISGQTKFSEVTGVVTARFVDTPGWHQNNTGWWYVYDLSNNYYTNCWALINNAWFYFTDAGYCLEYMWGYINGEWYFFGWGGYMQTGWQWLGGSWYFLDRYTGAMQCGWVHDGVWYYCDANLGGAMYDNCWAYISGNWYAFNEGGSMTQGWSYSYAYDGWFYLDPDTGHMLYGWQYIGGHWYYFYDNGLMAANTYVGTYWLGADGAMW